MTRFFSEPGARDLRRRAQRRPPSFEPEDSSDPYDRLILKDAAFRPPPPDLPDDPREVERSVGRRRAERGARPIFQRKHRPLIRDVSPSAGADFASSRDAENVQVAWGLGKLLKRFPFPPPIPGRAPEDSETDRETDREADRVFPNLCAFLFGPEEEESQARPNAFPQSDGDAEDEKPGIGLPSVPDAGWITSTR